MQRARIPAPAVLLLVVAAAVLVACEPRTDLVVDSTVDAVDTSPGDGVCETAAPGGCTLRAAIQEASALGGPVAIHLAPATTYALTIAGAGEDIGATGDLDTSGDIRLLGNGSSIDAELLDRVLDHHAGELTLEDVTLTDGQSREGAGLRNAAVAHLVDSAVTMNRGVLSPGDGYGGNVLHTGGTLDVVRSEVSGSTTLDAVGGGVVQLGGVVNIVDSTVTSNVSGYELHQLGGSATVVNSSLRGASWPFPMPYCTPSGCTIVEVQLSSSPLRVEGHVRIIRSTLARSSFDGTQIIYGSGGGEVEASGSMLYGTCSAQMTSSGYNAMRSGFPCAGTPHPSDLLLTGGPRETTGVPNIGEPIVDAIPVGTPGLCDGSDDHDVRLRPRPQGPGCDIGAVERQPDDPNV